MPSCRAACAPRWTAASRTGSALPTYGTVDLSIVQKIKTKTELRLDVLNIADNKYQIRNGSGVGVGASQFGLRRTILAGADAAVLIAHLAPWR